jgi:hypothetical protein
MLYWTGMKKNYICPTKFSADTPIPNLIGIPFGTFRDET